MKRKNPGASLIVVIIIFMFISIVSTAMLSMVLGNYRARVIESKRVENLYGADSGLNVVYNIIGKTIDAANKYGYLKVKKLQNLTEDDMTSPFNQDYIDLKKDIDYWKNYNSNQTDEDQKRSQDYIDSKISKDNEIINIIINEEFKRAFNNFMLDNNLSDKALNERIPDKLRRSIIDKSYVNEIKDLNNDDTSYDIAEMQFQNNDKALNFSIGDDDIIYSKGEKKDPINITVHSDDKNESHINIEEIYDKQQYTIKVKSDFESYETNSNDVGNNLRSVQAKYTIYVPNYSDIYFTQSTGGNKYLAFDDRALTIGGNMDVTNLSTLKVNGDIFVKGDKDKINDEYKHDYGIAYNKYKGGITLNNINNFVFRNDVITQATFNIGNSIGSESNPSLINGNLYSGNIYAGNLDGTSARNSYVHIGNLIVDNDLTLKADSTSITINNFYGINERTVNDDSDVNREKNSSCIIVNGNNNSNVDIKDNAYIMGVAYIDTKNKDGTVSDPYKTGESLAFKGNYIAYAIPDTEKSNETFSYRNPLNLLDYDNNGDEVDQKREHFENYWDGKLKGENTGGISLPDNTKAVGAIIYKDLTGNLKVKKESKNFVDNDTLTNTIIPKRREYARKVYNMGYPKKNEDYDSLLEDEKTNLQNLYDLKASPQYTLDTIMNLPLDIDGSNKYNYSVSNEAKSDKAEKAIFTKKNIVIQGDNASGNYDLNSDEYIFIDASENKEIDAVVATNGTVTIDGDVNFQGCIIAKGNLEIKGKNAGEGTSITYNPTIIKKVQFRNEDLQLLFKDAFGDAIDYEENNWQNDEEILNTNYDLSKFLYINLWKLVR